MNCPICLNVNAREVPSSGFDGKEIICPTCGLFSISRTLEATMGAALGEAGRKRALLSHKVFQMQNEGGKSASLTTTLFNRIIESETLPTPSEQADLLLIHAASMRENAGGQVMLRPETDNAIFGCSTLGEISFLAKSLEDEGLLKATRMMDASVTVTLTLAGWRKFEDLKQGQSETRKAFIAMQFGDPTLDRVVDEVFRQAVADTGFHLVRLDDNNPAGLIDDRLRVEIRTSRFLLADLSHSNKGAYWEAGYAEGLGKPVIYTCSEAAFADGGSHFDTNHHMTVVWNPDDLKKAAEVLKATIRATLPEEAIMEDR